MSVQILAALGGASLLAMAPGLASATAVFGSLANFDAVNDTGSVAHGFEIDLEGLHSADIMDTFGGPGRGFPPTVERYGAPTISEYNNGVTFGVKVIYGADLSGPSSGWIGTPTGVYSTPGESCWTGGGGGYGPGTPCDHFGVSTRGAAAKTTYNWLVESTPGSSSLIMAGTSVPAPTWTVTPQPPAPGNPNPPPIVMAQIAAPDPEGGVQFGDAIWVKVFTTEFDGPIDLRELVADNAKVQAAESNTEIEWQLLQKELGNPASGMLENGGEAGAGKEAVLRRYEFYAYSGVYNGEHEAIPVNGDTAPGPGELGAYVGAQNAAANFGPGAIGAVPEPATWAMMLVGIGGLGALMRGRRRSPLRSTPV